MSTVGGEPAWGAIMDETETGQGRPEQTAKLSGRSWASVLGQNLPKRDDKNVLEVVLEKDSRGSFNVKENECANLLRKLGLDPRPGVHVVGAQICPQGRGLIYITLKEEVELSRFCRHDVFEVTSSGIRVVLVKPAGKREVIVTAKGIHPNTKENVVFDYLAKFGKVTSNKVVHGVFSEGPLQGIRNGDRSYKMEIRPGTNIGSYHAIDGQKVTVRYPGQQQTCGRCHQTPRVCKGRGLARKCEAEGGVRIEFTDYILNLWDKIGYSPENLDLSDLETEDSVNQQNGGTFTPTKDPNSNASKFTGVSVKQFPKGADHGEIMEFLVERGLPDSKKEQVNISNSGTAIIRNLENEECLTLIESIHGKKYLDKKLFCNGFIPLTPEKIEDPSASKTKGDISEKSPSSTVPAQSTSMCDSSAPAKPLPHIKEFQESLSDFNSCVESSGDSSDEANADLKDDTGFKTANERKRAKKLKRKLNLTPGKQEFLKKPNTNTSPK